MYERGTGQIQDTETTQIHVTHGRDERGTRDCGQGTRLDALRMLLVKLVLGLDDLDLLRGGGAG